MWVTFALSLVIIGTHLLLNPRWQNDKTNATIGWDVAGYYLYLPAAFIYNDLKKAEFRHKVREQYHFTPDDIQGFTHEESGNYVMKYPMGQAIHFAPFFAIAHGYASASTLYPADGYSLPYQLMISIGSLLIALCGLFILRLVLRTYFSSLATALTLAIIALGSNYLNYTAIDGAMVHNTLFLWYAILLYLSDRWHKQPRHRTALAIGAVIGLMGLVRPTELLSAALPLLWGLRGLSTKDLTTHAKRLWDHKQQLLLAGIAAVLIGSLQLIYWYSVTGDWLVYSYEDQGFSWLSPHLMDGLLSWKSGWLTYSPLMVVSLIGFIHLFRQQRGIFWPALAFSGLFIYVAFAWDIWWYGGSLGQRTMVQIYPVLALPTAALLQRHTDWSKWLRGLLYTAIAIGFYISGWFTIQAHHGGMLHVGQMTKAYYLANVGRWKYDPELLKLLDTKHVYQGDRQNVEVIWQDTSTVLSVAGEKKYSQKIKVNLPDQPEWVRISADITIGPKEWNTWQMTQLACAWMSNSRVVSTSIIRLQRHLHDGQTRRLHIDSRPPDTPVDSLYVYLYNAAGTKACKAQNIVLEEFEE